MNTFYKHEQRKSKLKDLAERYALAGLFLLATDLRLDADSLLRIMSGSQGISPELGRRINYLWQIKFGKTYYPAPKSVLDIEIEIETIEKSSAFFYRDTMIGKKDPYKDIVFWDILPDFISEQEYDNALTSVRNRIIPVIDEMYKTLYVQPTSNISFVTLYGPERRANRTFELHIIERNDRGTDKPTYKVQYGLSYSQGDIQVLEGNIPADKANKMVYILRTEGDWES